MVARPAAADGMSASEGTEAAARANVALLSLTVCKCDIAEVHRVERWPGRLWHCCLLSKLCSAAARTPLLLDAALPRALLCLHMHEMAGEIVAVMLGVPVGTTATL